MTETIYALSSGRPPAAIAVVRVSGPAAEATCRMIAGFVPEPRRALLRRLRDQADQTLDYGLVLFFPGPASATGEDLLELHLHGGRAVVAAVQDTLSRLPALRQAAPGEFTRRALENGRIDLIQAEGLADLLEAETEGQRRAALTSSEGVLSRRIADWLERISVMAACIEAELDFADEGDVVDNAPYDPTNDADVLADEMTRCLKAPSVERLRDGALIVIAGPRNAGKSSLFNALLTRDAAIVTPIAGTTRDVLEAAVVRRGTPYRLVDTAGLTEATDDVVERIGIERANSVIAAADLVLWMGRPSEAPSGALRLRGKCDLDPENIEFVEHDLPVSSMISGTVEHLWGEIERHVAPLLASSNDVMLHERQRELVRAAAVEVAAIRDDADPLLHTERLRIAGRRLGELMGIDASEAMLDSLFGRFCLGK